MRVLNQEMVRELIAKEGTVRMYLVDYSGKHIIERDFSVDDYNWIVAKDKNNHIVCRWVDLRWYSTCEIFTNYWEAWAKSLKNMEKYND